MFHAKEFSLSRKERGRAVVLSAAFGIAAGLALSGGHAATANAESVIPAASDFCYIKNDDGTVTVNGYKGSASDIMIPRQLTFSESMIKAGEIYELGGKNFMALSDSVEGGEAEFIYLGDSDGTGKMSDAVTKTAWADMSGADSGQALLDYLAEGEGSVIPLSDLAEAGLSGIEKTYTTDDKDSSGKGSVTAVVTLPSYTEFSALKSSTLQSINAVCGDGRGVWTRSYAGKQYYNYGQAYCMNGMLSGTNCKVDTDLSRDVVPAFWLDVGEAALEGDTITSGSGASVTKDTLYTIGSHQYYSTATTDSGEVMFIGNYSVGICSWMDTGDFDNGQYFLDLTESMFVSGNGAYDALEDAGLLTSVVPADVDTADKNAEGRGAISGAHFFPASYSEIEAVGSAAADKITKAYGDAVWTRSYSGYEDIDRAYFLGSFGLNASRMSDPYAIAPAVCINISDLSVFGGGTSTEKTYDVVLDRTWTDESFFGTDENDTIKSVSFEDGVKAESLLGFFSKCRALESVDFTGLDVSDVTSMSGMLSECSALERVKIPETWDSSNVTSMIAAFATYSDSLKEIEGLQYLDTGSVGDMSYMFAMNKGIEVYDLSGFDTSSAVNMSSMFYGNENLLELDFTKYPGFTTSNVVEMSGMFEDCKKLSKIDVSTFDTSSVENMFSIFNNDESLEEIDLSGWDISSITNPGNTPTFDGDKSLKKVKTPKVQAATEFSIDSFKLSEDSEEFYEKADDGTDTLVTGYKYLCAAPASTWLYRNTGSTGADVPTEPDEPAGPEEPDVPTEPDEPTQPDELTQPDVPAEPDTPKQPDDPVEPDMPTEPDEPTKPDVPKEPENPKTQKEPENPDTPVMPDKPDVSSGQGNSAGTDEAKTPVEPDDPLTPDDPKESEDKGSIDEPDDKKPDVNEQDNKMPEETSPEEPSQEAPSSQNDTESPEIPEKDPGDSGRAPVIYVPERHSDDSQSDDDGSPSGKKKEEPSSDAAESQNPSEKDKKKNENDFPAEAPSFGFYYDDDGTGDWRDSLSEDVVPDDLLKPYDGSVSSDKRKIIGVTAAAVAAGTGFVILTVSGGLNYIWTLLLLLLFRWKKKKFHGLITEKMNRHVEVKGSAKGQKRTLQSIINEKKNPAVIMKSAMECGIMTYLPLGTKMIFTYKGKDGKYKNTKMNADETRMYDILSGLKGPVTVTFLNKPAKIELMLKFDI